MIEEDRRAKLFDVEPSENAITSFKSRGSSHVDQLGSASDLSKLERLDMDHYSPNFFTDSNGLPNKRFRNLRHFSMKLGTYWEERAAGEVESFLCWCKPLEGLELSYRGDPGVPSLDVILFHHGRSLNTLALHEPETVSLVQPTLSVEELREIGRRCPLLEDLAIDIVDLDSGNLKATLGALATVPNLQIIRLCVPLGIAEEEARTPWMFLDEEEAEHEAMQHRKRPFSPLGNEKWLENTWAVLRDEKKKCGSKRLRELHVKVGEWEREVGIGYPAGWVIWEASNRRYFVARENERDDKKDEIVVEVFQSHPLTVVERRREVRDVPEIGFVDF